MDPRHFDRFTRAFGARLSRRSALATGVGLSGLTISSSSRRLAAAQEATPAPSEHNEPNWLLLQRFASATLSPKADGAALILEGVEPTVLAFTDRPARLARTLSSVEAWNWANAPSDPPNATLLAVPAEGGNEVAVVVELVDPSYDEAAGRLTTTVRLLGDGAIQALTEERRFGTGHLFIDDLSGTLPPCTTCDSNPSFYQFRFNYCASNDLNGPESQCPWCAGWAYCNGTIDTGTSCGTVQASC